MAPPTVTYFVPGVTGQKEAARNGEIEDFGQRHSRFAAQDAGLGIEGEEAVHAEGLQQHAIFEQADIAVAAAGADGQQAGGWGLRTTENRRSSSRVRGLPEVLGSGPSFQSGDA